MRKKIMIRHKNQNKIATLALQKWMYDRKKLSTKVAKTELVYWSVCSSSRRGGDGGLKELYKSAASFT